MAEAQTLKIARLVALAHIIVGVLLFIFGIVDRVEGYFWTGEGCFGIWCGVWMIITGSLGIPASSRERNSSSQAFAAAFMGFAITSAVFGGVIIICFSTSIAIYHHYWYGYYDHWYNYDAEMAITAITLVLGIVEFAIGIWAAVLCCYVNACACCTTQSNQATSVVYVSNQGGYIMGQGPGGVPVAIPMQAAGGVVAVPVSSSGAVGAHPQMMHPQMVQMPAGGVVHVPGQPQMYRGPTAGVVGMQPQIVQVPTSGGLVGQPHVVQGQVVQRVLRKEDNKLFLKKKNTLQKQH
ncbi:hypothetical protein ACROYT_G029849 [Oculina patagonica]